ncbi:MAG: hypothetical protein GXY08_07610 [Ruminococcus sp.]|nr:hypothetical protein [Ruminococcus sp.]
MNKKVMIAIALIGTVACLLSAFFAAYRGRIFTATAAFIAGFFCLGCTAKIIRNGTFF